jgi:hypothetical protein
MRLVLVRKGAEAEADAGEETGRGESVGPGEGSKVSGRKRGNASWTNGCMGYTIGTGTGGGGAERTVRAPAEDNRGEGGKEVFEGLRMEF